MAEPAGAPNLDGLLQKARQGNNNALGDLLEVYGGYLRLLARLQIDRRLQGSMFLMRFHMSRTVRSSCERQCAPALPFAFLFNRREDEATAASLVQPAS